MQDNADYLKERKLICLMTVVPLNLGYFTKSRNTQAERAIKIQLLAGTWRNCQQFSAVWMTVFPIMISFTNRVGNR